MTPATAAMGKIQSSSDPGGWRLVALLVIGMTAWRLFAAALLPVTQDEAYYFDWARHLTWGYFDHPPGVALLGMGIWLAPGSALAARLGALLAGALTLVVLARLYVHSGLTRRDDLSLALVLVFTTLAGLVGGFITTPDSVLALAWALTLHEAERALAGDRRRWLSAGVAAGLGLLGKYTMGLIGPVLLWAILRTDPRALRTPWPYLGGLLALVVFTPNLAWNAQHDWVTLRFQFGHGFATDSGPLAGAAGEAGATITHSASVSAADAAANLISFLGGQLGLWGLLALPLLAVPWLARRPVADGGRPAPLPHGRPLLLAAALFPLVFFALVSLRSDVEPNWPAMYLLAAPALLAPLLRRMRHWVLGLALVNLLLVTLYAVHGATAALPLPDSQNRILRETHGFRELAEVAGELDAPVYADRYQLAAMLRFYRPDLATTQWPGITRPSEYLRGVIAPRVDPGAITEPLWLVTRAPRPPPIHGLVPRVTRTLSDCPGLPLSEADPPPCARPLHRWHLHRYGRQE